MEQRDPSKWLLLFSCAAVLFSYGIAVGRYQVFPYSLLKFGKDSVATVFEDRNTILRIRPDRLLRPARDEGRGVTRNIAGRTEPGLTFISSLFGDAKEMRLIRLDGSVVQRWPVQFAKMFPNTSHIEPKDQIPQTEWNSELHGGLVLPDGSVVFNFEGAGLAKLDKCGAVEWTLPRMTHHSVERAKGGGFWVPAHRYVTDPAALPPLKPPFEEDTLLKVSEDGEVVKEISVPGLLLKNKLQGLLFVRVRDMAIPNADLTHLNDIEELSLEMAPRFPQFAPGDLVISMRELNTIMVIDPVTELVKWYKSGPWMGQHDPDFEPTGRISVFSNNDDGTRTGSVLGGSTILEVDPMSGVTHTLYGGSAGRKMYTVIRGKHQQFVNGNLLITEAEAGRVLEVDRKGEIVWEYINRYDDKEVAIVFGAIRYPEHYFTVSDWSCP